MSVYTAVIEPCRDTQLLVAHVPGFPGAHAQGETLEELRHNLLEVLQMLSEIDSHSNSRTPPCPVSPS